MSKNKNKDFAYVNLQGTVVFSDVVRYDNNQKELHNYFIQVTEKYTDKKCDERYRKHSFKATQFGLRKNSDVFMRGDRVKIKGFLKVNSYKNDDDEWVNQVYVAISEIDYAKQIAENLKLYTVYGFFHKFQKARW